MFEIASKFAPARDTVTWAETGLKEFEQLFKNFFELANVKIVSGIDAGTGVNFQKAVLTHELPKELTRKATDVLNNAKHAFDQATYAALSATNPSQKKSVYFPWAESLADLNRLLITRKIPENLWSTFQSLEPFPRSKGDAGDNGLVRAMAKMANNKHTIGLSIGADVEAVKFPRISGIGLSSLRIMMPRWDPVKNEAILLRWSGLGTVDVSGDYKFTFTLNFSDKVFERPVPAGPALAEFVAYARVVTERLQGKCLDGCNG